MFKKIMASLLALTMVFGIGSQGAVDLLPDTAIKANAFLGSDYMYRVLEDGTVELGEYIYKEYPTHIDIPSEINGRPVSTLAWWSFDRLTELESVTIPNTIKLIKDQAFLNDPKLKSVTIPPYVQEVQDKAFGYISHWHEEEQNNTYEKVEGFKIYCYRGSAGEKYARENGFDYEIVGSVPFKGDINADGAVDSADVIKAASHVKGTSTLTAAEQLRADVNGDGNIDSADVVKLAAYVKGTGTLD